MCVYIYILQVYIYIYIYIHFLANQGSLVTILSYKWSRPWLTGKQFPVDQHFLSPQTPINVENNFRKSISVEPKFALIFFNYIV